MSIKNQGQQYPELWGGIECTISRIHNSYKDQLQLARHYERPGDLEDFAKLGIKKIRYPVLWEKHIENKNGVIDWRWTARQLNKLTSLNIEPIAGLLHHGSGPSYTSLLNAAFPHQLAAYAKKVATRFPFINYYTPVNEPLTTARFSGLYGLWFPHHKSEYSFLTILLNQLEGTVLAMKAIREINPAARLLQTEDIGNTHSSAAMQYQADFENNRRWLTYDLLCGLVNESHPLWNYFICNGIKRERLLFFIANPCKPAIAGFNYYVTSERYIDENIQRYRHCEPGSNGRHCYVDTEAARVTRLLGVGNLLEAAWQRYRLPIAVTEAHLQCTREDQLRWFKEIWDDCSKLIKKGIPVKAVTAWSLLGAYDWNTLLTKNSGYYETGVFDISNEIPRPTAMVKLLRSLSETGEYDHPVLQNRGWWHRHNPGVKNTSDLENNAYKKPLLIIGKTGTLGSAFSIICKKRGIHYVILSREQIDITSQASIASVMQHFQPWAVVNTAAYVNIDDAEQAIQECFAANAVAPALLAEACKQQEIPFLTFSTDMVFKGDKNQPYIETDAVYPLNIYGNSKASGEAAVLAANEKSLIVRTSAFFGPWDRYNFAHSLINALSKQQSYTVVKDIMVSPTYVPDLANTALDLLIDEANGVWHLSNEGEITWADFAEALAKRAGLKSRAIIKKTAAEMPLKAKRPQYSVLGSEKGIKLPGLHDAIDRYFIEKAD